MYWVMSTWALSLSYVLFIIIMTLLVIYNEYHLPETIWGYKCYGFFPKCDMDICVDLGGSPGEGIKSASEVRGRHARGGRLPFRSSFSNSIRIRRSTNFVIWRTRLIR